MLGGGNSYLGIRLGRVLAGLMLAAVGFSCSSDDGGGDVVPADSSPAGGTSANGSPTAFPSASPAVVVDDVILAVNEAILSGDVDRLLNLLSYIPRPCEAISDTARVPCAAGMAPGTMVDTFAAGACGEGAIIPRGSEQLGDVLRSFVRGGLALQSVVRGSLRDDYEGQATLVYTAESGNEIEKVRLAVVDERGLVTFRYGCGLGIEHLVGPDPEYIVPPAR